MGLRHNPYYVACDNGDGDTSFCFAELNTYKYIKEEAIAVAEKYGWTLAAAGLAIKNSKPYLPGTFAKGNQSIKTMARSTSCFFKPWR